MDNDKEFTSDIASDNSSDNFFNKECDKIKEKWDLIMSSVSFRQQTAIREVLDSTFELMDSMNAEIFKLAHNNTRDMLTGVFNRAYCNHILESITPSPEYPITIVAGDVNNLKLTNDAFGHHAGDMLLKTIADIMKSCGKEHYIIGRFGGDEFNVILPNAHLAEGEEYCARIKKACSEYKDLYLPPSISLGVKECADCNYNIAQTLSAAEELMYTDKTIFKSQQNIFTDIIQQLYARNLINKHTIDETIQIINGFGRFLGLNEQTVSKLRLAARIHDIGFIAIPSEIILKPSRSVEDRKIISKHSEIGYRLAKLYDESFPVANIILQHHETWDGNGYPKGLVGNEILFSAQILSLVSTYTSWYAPRPLGSGLSRQEAFNRIDERIGTQFDPRLLKQFKQYLTREVFN